ncbi:MAG: hypothetical protein Q9220_007505 [cf. Caloplaca sp. 1 TL-2023]
MEQPEQQTATQVLPVNVDRIGSFIFNNATKEAFLGEWSFHLAEKTDDTINLLRAVGELQTSNVPVAFPTETVYGLGADASRELAVTGIYKAKQRPADNPLIVHISSLAQLRTILDPSCAVGGQNIVRDPIPAIYHPLISRFWPGPLTIILPLPHPSPLAPAVTCGLPTFGVRMPSSRLALALIHLAGIPLAAPSANASTRPSPTTAQHVLHDLSGRINLILDGGSCAVGVESTVVDGLTDPPVILRPGGISIEMIRQCPQWDNVAVGYTDGSQLDAPRAPGMKYKHYSPHAKVILVNGPLTLNLLRLYLPVGSSLGLAKTKCWKDDDLTRFGESAKRTTTLHDSLQYFEVQASSISQSRRQFRKDSNEGTEAARPPFTPGELQPALDVVHVFSAELGNDAADIARNLFSVLRELDLQGVDVILVEAIDDHEGDAATAVMNRLKKAAELQIQA